MLHNVAKMEEIGQIDNELFCLSSLSALIFKGIYHGKSMRCSTFLYLNAVLRAQTFLEGFEDTIPLENMVH